MALAGLGAAWPWAGACLGTLAVVFHIHRKRRFGLGGDEGEAMLLIRLVDLPDGQTYLKLEHVNRGAASILGHTKIGCARDVFSEESTRTLVDEALALESAASAPSPKSLKKSIILRFRDNGEAHAGAVSAVLTRVGPRLFQAHLSSIVRGCEEVQRTRALRTDLELNRAIVDTLVDGIISIDSKGIVQSFNRTAQRIFQYDPSEVIGRNVKMLMPSPYAEEHDGYLEQYMTTGKKRIIGSGREVTGLRKDGTTFPMFLSVSEAIAIGSARHFAGIVRDMSREKSDRERLVESERRNQAILDTAVDGIISIDSKCIIRSANHAACILFKHNVDQMIGKNVKMLMPEPYKSQHDAYVENYLRTGIKKIIGMGREVVGRRSDGTCFPMDLAVSEVQVGAEGIYFTGIIRDVTERKEAIEKIREAEEQTRAIVDTAYDGILTIGDDGRILTFNRSAERIYGISAADAVGTPFTALLPEASRREQEEDFRAFLRSGQSRIIGRGPVPITARRKSGDAFPSEVSIAPHHATRDGRRVFTIIARDISDLIQLVESNRRKQSLLESAADGIVSYGQDGTIISANSAAARLLGVGKDGAELVGLSMLELCRAPPAPESKTPEHQRDIATLLGLRPDCRTRAPFISVLATYPDGRSVPLELSISAARASPSPEKALTAVIRPGAEERAALEKELHKARMELIKARAGPGDMLRQEHLAYLSHEIRNHLHGALSMNALLLDTRLDPAQREYAESVQSMAGSLRHLADDILTFSASDAESLRFESVAFDVEDVVESAAELFSPGAFGKGVEIACYVDPRIGICRGDPHRLTQVIVNLVSNSVKFTRDGSVVVTAEVAPAGSPPLRGRPGPAGRRMAGERLGDREAAPIHVRFEVRDTGIGLDEGAASRLFADFSQATASIARQFGGAGLGLAISRRVVEGFGGRLTVYSAGPNRGCTFSFTIPLQRGARRGSRPPPPVPARGVVLLMKDPATAEVYARKLRGMLLPARYGEGPRVAVATTALQAIELLEGPPPEGPRGESPGAPRAPPSPRPESPAPGSPSPALPPGTPSILAPRSPDSPTAASGRGPYSHLLVDVRRCGEEDVARKLPWARLAALKASDPGALRCVFLSEPRPHASAASASPPALAWHAAAPPAGPSHGLRRESSFSSSSSSSRRNSPAEPCLPADPRLAVVPEFLRNFFDAVVSKPCRTRRLAAAMTEAPPPPPPPVHSSRLSPTNQPSPPHKAAGRPRRILVVDDVLINRKVAATMLEKAGHIVDQAADGELAVAAVAASYADADSPEGAAGRQPYDLVLMDVQMPRMDGHMATRCIRDMERMTARRLPIIALTGNASEADVAACRESGMDAHISKPFRRENLIDAVAQWSRD